MKNWVASLVGVFFLMFAAGAAWGWLAPAEPAPAWASGLEAPLEAGKPVYNWWVCEDLGLGAVPGVTGQRQRFRLCHHQDWEVLAYCTQPGMPAPSVGDRCTRISGHTYQCGSGVQLLREYDIVDTPAPSPTNTATPGPNDTPTPTPTMTSQAPTQTQTPTSSPSPTATARGPVSTVRPRVHPGGTGLLEYIFPFLAQRKSQVTPTPFQPLAITPTASLPLHAIEAAATPEPPADFYGMDFSNNARWVRIRIIPKDKAFNGGKPVIIAFIPGKNCVFGDDHACVSSYQPAGLANVTFLSIHSGIGGEAETFRQAVEGIGLDQAAYSLKRVQANLRWLEGADVVITQGKKRLKGFTLASVGRVPPRGLKEYFAMPVSEALSQAAVVQPGLAAFISPVQPLLVFETCGWAIPGEAQARSATDTSASVYLGVIIRKP